MNLAPTFASQPEPVLLALTGPFASGKTAIADAFKKRFGYVRPRTMTTRAPRADEIDGLHYHFRAVEEAKRMIERNELLEWVMTNGNIYGTPRSEVLAPLEQGLSIALCVDIKGVILLSDHENELIRRSLVSVYLEAPFSQAVARARKRPGGMVFEELRRRTATRWEEERLKHHARHRIANPDGAFEETFSRVSSIAMRHRIECECAR